MGKKHNSELGPMPTVNTKDPVASAPVGRQDQGATTRAYRSLPIQEPVVNTPVEETPVEDAQDSAAE